MRFSASECQILESVVVKEHVELRSAVLNIDLTVKELAVGFDVTVLVIFRMRFDAFILEDLCFVES